MIAIETHTSLVSPVAAAVRYGAGDQTCRPLS
jgi:hypothetical protein